ncbi:MAG: T9SS type A sorting domain-containing protein [Flavobacteriales bacterium]
MLSVLSVDAQSDIENIVVEKYYISDENDATDTDGGALAPGSTTYRVFLDLAPGVKLRGFYANSDHPFVISSTEVFFNNQDRGEPFGFDIPENRIDENTVALDSWLTLGRATGIHWAVQKSLDNDGSLVGGVNSDGGSESVPGGILVNASPDAGIPLTTSDGLVPYTGAALVNFIATGDALDPVFGEFSAASEFNTTSFSLLNEGIEGQTEDNVILIAQLTTTGELSFSLNVRVIRADGSLISYVADGSVLAPDEAVSSFLTYPPQCGCTDPDFLEYDSAAGCDDGSCATLVMLGCNDPAACNYDPDVNFNVPELCCILPDNCIGLDPDLICSGFVGINEIGASRLWSVYPNPTSSDFQIKWTDEGTRNADLTLCSMSGGKVWSASDVRFEFGDVVGVQPGSRDAGVYVLTIQSGGEVLRFPIVFMP